MTKAHVAVGIGAGSGDLTERGEGAHGEHGERRFGTRHVKTVFKEVRADQSEAGAKAREVKNNSPRGFLQSAEFLHLPVNCQIEERHRKRQKRRPELVA